MALEATAVSDTDLLCKVIALVSQYSPHLTYQVLVVLVVPVVLVVLVALFDTSNVDDIVLLSTQ